MNAPPRADGPASPGRGLLRGFAALGLALSPALLAIAATPGFSTQDGPAHVFSARILNASLAPGSPFAATFRVAWEPLPNWAGHLATMAAVATFPPEVANRVVTAATLVALAAATLWLRWVVAGPRGIEVAALLAALLALNVTWLLGFTSFLLGAALAPATLAWWWSGRDRFGPRRSAGLAALLVVGYFCHPIGLGLTLGALAVLATLNPGAARVRRAAWTAASGAPLVPLGLAYRALTRSGGGLEPVWAHWNPSLAGVSSQVGWVDPLSLAAKTVAPLGLPIPGALAALLAPAVWIAAAIGALAASTWRGRDRERRGWLVAAVGLLGVGLVAPDTLGVKHGHFLPQRVVLLGLVVLVPWLDLGRGGLTRRCAVAALVGALMLQAAVVWDYTRACRDRVGPFLEAAREFGPGVRAGTLLNEIRGPFRANPLLHADCLIAAQADSIFWTNYETAQYYFPVKVRADVPHPVATDFEEVAIRDEPRDADRRLRLWEALIRDHAAEIDRVVEWGRDPRLDEALRRDYSITARRGPIRVWARRPADRGSD